MSVEDRISHDLHPSANFGKDGVRWRVEPDELRLRSLLTEATDESIGFGPAGRWLFDPLPIQVEVSDTPLAANAAAVARAVSCVGVLDVRHASDTPTH
jgi:hypothetical protein